MALGPGGGAVEGGVGAAPAVAEGAADLADNIQRVLDSPGDQLLPPDR